MRVQKPSSSQPCLGSSSARFVIVMLKLAHLISNRKRCIRKMMQGFVIRGLGLKLVVVGGAISVSKVSVVKFQGACIGIIYV